VVTAVEQPALTPAGPAPLSRGRKIAIWALVIVASLIALVSILTTWVTRQMLDAHSWHNASTKVIQDPAVQALATQLVNELYANVDVGAQSDASPEELEATRRSGRGSLRDPATRGVEFCCRSRAS
jgi:hypothetical protein